MRRPGLRSRRLRSRGLRPRALRRSCAAACVALLALAPAGVLTDGAAGQTLEDRVRSAGEGPVRFAFEAREGVCGRAESVWISDDARRPGGACDCPCRSGPVRVELRDLRDGLPGSLDARVGSDWPDPTGPRAGRSPVELGMVPPSEAVDYLLELAANASGDVGEEAVSTATLARDVEEWPRLLTLARDGSIPRDTRRAAVFWLGQAAEEAATRGLVSVVEDAGAIEIREHAIFALSQRDDEAAF
ncbi:MAG: hypothetical protein R3266_10790, partial [Gemmatimonadota bacterium]|nr:hypothetical protein [Gemmatimonadota bacterium]